MVSQDMKPGESGDPPATPDSAPSAPMDAQELILLISGLIKIFNEVTPALATEVLAHFEQIANYMLVQIPNEEEAAIIRRALLRFFAARAEGLPVTPEMFLSSHLASDHCS